MHNRHCDFQGPDGGHTMSVGGVRDGGCGQEVWEGQEWRVWPRSVGGSGMEGVAMQCYTAQAWQPIYLSSYPSYTTLHDHDNDNNHTVTHDLFQLLDTYTQLMQVQLYNMHTH